MAGYGAMLSQRARVKVFPENALVHQRNWKAFIGISLNNRAGMSPVLLMQVFDWTKRNLGPFDLLVGDYLNRHNYQAFSGLTESVATEQAMRDGKQATERLRLLISTSPFESSIISAGALYQDPTFADRLARFERHFADNDNFRTLIHEAVDVFLARKYRSARLDSNVRAHCVAYQL